MRRFDFNIKIYYIPYELQLTIASSPKLPYFTFVDLYKTDDYKILIELAKNENIPSDIAWDMVRQYETLKKEEPDGPWRRKGDILCLLAKNEKAPISLLKYLSYIAYGYRNCNMSATIMRLARETRERIGEECRSSRYYKVFDVSQPKWVFEQILKYEPKQKKFEVACNPALPLKSMYEILNSNDDELKYFLAKNEAVPLEILEELIKQYDEQDDNMVKFVAMKRIEEKINGTENF